MNDNELMHYGTKYHSGRFPYGSGENPFQHDKSGFYKEYKTLNDKGMSESKIAEYFDKKYYNGEGTFNTTVLRAYVTIGREQEERNNITRALYLRDERHMGSTAIGREMGVPESTVRSWLDPSRQEKMSSTRAVADVIKNQIEDYAKEDKYLDVGKATELQLNCSRTKLNTALAMLQDEGYVVNYIKIPQAGTDNNTEYKVITKPDVEWKEIRNNTDRITPVEGIQPAKDAKYFEKIPDPKSISSDRVAICYAEDGGIKKDGVIEIRPGVQDLSLGENNYAQVRIEVDGTHYLKGMAIYSNDIPDGYDIKFNTNKTSDKDKMEVLKPLEKVKKNGVETNEVDTDKPFGATIKKVNTYIDENGKEQQTAINVVNDDIEWDKWSKNLASQFLSKQNKGLAKQQLQLAYDQKESEFEEISQITNPTLKKKLLNEFAESCDSAAVHLKAAPFPRQATHVILPLTEIKDNEIYAPNYKNGEEVVLIRYPHAGTFEIPRLKVNNNNKQGIELLGQAKNAVGINSNVAEQLSGADFDGDTVVVIPTSGHDIKTSRRLKDLENFEPKTSYKAYDGMPKTCAANGFRKQQEMGKVSNLITDMTIRGATEADLACAVKHSMVVIDAEKHNLDWRQSYKDNNIAYLKEKYQGGKNSGASTLISKAKSEEHIPKRKLVTSANDKDITEQQRKDFLEGKLVWKDASESYLSSKNIKPSEMTDKQREVYKKAKATYKETGVVPKDTNGIKFEVVTSRTTTTKMAEATDAFELSSGTQMEAVYANHANKLKSLANNARKEALATQPIKYSPTAAKTYATEVNSLMGKLKVAELNKPLERQAQAIADKVVRSKIADDPDLKTDKDALKKVNNKAIANARAQVGAKKEPIHITDKEWEAIQSGAVSNSRQISIFANTDDKELKKLATPKKTTGLSSSQISRAKRLLNAGYPQSEVAESLGISTSTLKKYVNF